MVLPSLAPSLIKRKRFILTDSHLYQIASFDILTFRFTYSTLLPHCWFQKVIRNNDNVKKYILKRLGHVDVQISSSLKLDILLLHQRLQGRGDVCRGGQKGYRTRLTASPFDQLTKTIGCHLTMFL